MPTLRKRTTARGTLYWEGSLQVDGRRVWVTGRSRQEVLERLQALQRQAALQGGLPAPLTLGELLERWYATERSRWKPKTAHDYRRLLDAHILPALSRVRLQRLSPDRLQRFLDGIPGTRQRHYAYRLLHRAAEVARRWGWLPDNPCDRITPPAYRPSRPSLWTPEQVRQFLTETRDHWLWPFVALALDTGARPGELLALVWDGVDWERGTLRIERTLQRLRGEWVIGEPKTAAGRRTVSLGVLGREALRRQKALQAERRLRAGVAWQETGLVFTGEHGQPLGLETVTSALRRTCQRLGLPVLSPHKLRHLSASLALQHGAPLPLVSRRLGHSSPAITSALYSHALTEDRLVAQVLEQALGLW